MIVNIKKIIALHTPPGLTGFNAADLVIHPRFPINSLTLLCIRHGFNAVDLFTTARRGFAQGKTTYIVGSEKYVVSFLQCEAHDSSHLLRLSIQEIDPPLEEHELRALKYDSTDYQTYETSKQYNVGHIEGRISGESLIIQRINWKYEALEPRLLPEQVITHTPYNALFIRPAYHNRGFGTFLTRLIILRGLLSDIKSVSHTEVSAWETFLNKRCDLATVERSSLIIKPRYSN